MESLRAKTKKPTHPGAILREDILPELKMTPTKLAKQLHVSRYLIAEIIHERRAITPDIAIRLARFLGTTANSWLNMQQAVDIWELEQNKKGEYDLIQKRA